MAGQVLENGVILPAEYSDDWYDDMTSNLTKLDEVIGSDSEKLSSADVGAAAISNDYTDLDNKPNLTPYDTHLANSDIHVTAADKSKWNNGVSQSYVLRYSSASVTDNSTIAFSTLDNTDNIKSGDKVIDVEGKIFSVVSVDTANQTVTVGSALIDLALDGNVVHTSGKENVGGIKNFTDDTFIKSLNFTNEVASTSSSSSSIMPIITTVTYTDQTASKSARINLRITASGDKSLYPHENNQYALGLTSRKWSEVHATTYYYGSSDTEFSQKFVTTDTDQPISSSKTFTGSQYYKDNNVQYFGIDFTKGTAPTAYTARCTYFSPLTGGGSTYQTSNGLVGCAVNNDNVVTTFMHAIKNTAGTTTRTSFVLYYDTDNDKRSVTTNGDFLPIISGQGVGNSTSKWATINGLEPSALGMPDLNNAIDISSYITTGYTDNNYTPSVNGWIWIRLIGNGASIIQGDFGINSSYVTNNLTSEKWVETNLFVTKNVQSIIRCCGITGIVSAYFYPCLGNV